ncbi:type III pantothenate kinase [Flavobacterium chuncheonense]|uniref:Type III pantothenate kinase n=1 Tax=Flavobacterium chuncheonense TaxID=2026653 RepID=A0ABW5YLI0_9FLAO
MLLTIDIGNTRIKSAVFEQNSLQEKFVFDTKDAKYNFEQILKKFPSIKNSISSSVSNLNTEAIEYLKQNTALVEISHQTKFPFHNLYQTPTTLGVDRMVLAAGASLQFPHQNCLIIDSGTCITYDFIDASQNYLGGAISPGLSIRYKSLNTFTAKLPLLENKEPENFIGNNTNEAIHSGVVNGLRYEIEGFIARYLHKYQDLTIILTGGDAEFLAKSLKSIIFANPNFLLESLNQLFTYCIKKND